MQCILKSRKQQQQQPDELLLAASQQFKDTDIRERGLAPSDKIIYYRDYPLGFYSQKHNRAPDASVWTSLTQNLHCPQGLSGS